MKAAVLFSLLLVYLPSSFAQTGTSTFLTWMKGDNTIGQPGIYGTKGLPAEMNKPGARDFSATWRDNNGDLWLFGGYGHDARNQVGYLNDLWKFNPSINKWTWIHGDSLIDQHSVYGQQGLAHENNKPGSVYASVSWTDASGNLWLFGGFGFTSTSFGFLNSLWKYNPSTNEWTWIKGDDNVDEPATYGNIGVARNNNKPGARYGSRTWTDASGKLWLFGGYGYDNSNSGNLNDLWKFDPATNKWTWVNGDDIINHVGAYGTKGLPSATSKPGARYLSHAWTDTNNNLWLFGGYGFNDVQEGQLNDLWKYNIATNQWTWVNGDNTTDAKGVYGTPGIADASNKPGARYIGVSWTDASNNLWLCGGYGFSNSLDGYMNDLWKYNVSANTWTWIKGDSSVNGLGAYGTQGMPTATNKPGARTSSVSWIDGNGHLWFFGGFGYDESNSGMLNDLWKISSFQVLPIQLLWFNGVMKSDVITLQWRSQQEETFSHYTVQRCFDGVNFTDIGIRTAGNNNGLADYTYGDDIRNIGESRIFYRLQLLTADGNVTYSKTIHFDRNKIASALHLYPNPATQYINVTYDQKSNGPTTFLVTDMKGVAVKSFTQSITPGKVSMNIDLNSIAAGAYVLSVIQNGENSQEKFIKQ
jgi:N-acetylneuraminic acid mutarotase